MLWFSRTFPQRRFLVREALSPAVITPGRTTVGDVRRWLYDALARAGVSTWFQPDLRVQRRGAPVRLSRGFLAVAKEATAIERGDLLHVDTMRVQRVHMLFVMPPESAMGDKWRE